MDLTSSDIHLYKLADAFDPGTWLWLVTSLTSPYPIAYHVPERVGSYHYSFSGLQRSSLDFGSSVSLSTLKTVKKQEGL